MRLSMGIGGCALGFFAGLMEVSVLSFLPHPWKDASVLLPIAVYLSLYTKPHVAVLYAATAGLLVELFLIQHPSYALAKFLLLIALVMLAARSILTNHSLYAGIALIFLVTLVNLFAEWIAGIPLTPAGMLFRGMWSIGLFSLVFALHAHVSQRFYSFRHPSRLYDT